MLCATYRYFVRISLHMLVKREDVAVAAGGEVLLAWLGQQEHERLLEAGLNDGAVGVAINIKRRLAATLQPARFRGARPAKGVPEEAQPGEVKAPGPAILWRRRELIQLT